MVEYPEGILICSVFQLLNSQVKVKIMITIADHLKLVCTSFNCLYIIKGSADIRRRRTFALFLIVLEIGFSFLNEGCHAFLTVFL